MSMTHVGELATYKSLVMAGYGMFGLGLGIYATPSVYTAVSAAPEEKAAVAAGIYKLASSLGGAMGVALSLATYSAWSDVDLALAGARGLWLNMGFAILALLSILLLVPGKNRVPGRG